jgi:hypothetical protein
MENHYGEKLPEVGLFTHTKIPQLYKVDKNVWLVDFPGSNGIENYADYFLHFQLYQVLFCCYWNSLYLLYLPTISFYV